MTDKEFKHLSRAQLIDIIYQLQLRVDEVTEQNEKLEQELADKRIRLSEAGDIANASLVINDCFRSAQNAAEQFLNEIKIIREETEAERKRIISKAQEEAAAIVVGAKLKQGEHDPAEETVLKELRQSHSDNG